VKKLVIFGVGLIGGSVALALRKTYPELHIVGIGRALQLHDANLQTAHRLGVIDEISIDLSQALHGATLILIATPVAQTPAILQSILPHLDKNTVITDAGSTKADVVEYAINILGERVNQFVPAHPIAGAEKSGVTAANAALYVGKNVIITPIAATNPAAIDSVTAMWKTTGAVINQMTPAQHDSVFAAVSHLPHLLAFALVEELAARKDAEEFFKFAASGFRDFTRIAGSSPEMWRDISLANRKALLEELSVYQAQLSLIENLLNNNDSAGLQSLFERASAARNAWAHQQAITDKEQTAKQ
jgi:prephenate dehydrogenase